MAEVFAFFVAETSHVDVVIRTEAMKKVTVVAALLGPEKLHAQLLPYLQTKLTDLDQVLLALAGKLGNFLPFMGGNDKAAALIAIFEELLGIEETSVRSAASASVAQILQQLSRGSGGGEAAAVQAYLELFLKLSNEEAGEIFYSRVSACQFLPELYQALPDEAARSAMRESYVKLCADDMSMVKRAAAISFVRLATVVTPEVLAGDMMQVREKRARERERE